jgi:hypothetical protein
MPRLRSWKLEPNPTAIREGPTERKTALETTGSIIRRLRRNQNSVSNSECLLPSLSAKFGQLFSS